MEEEKELVNLDEIELLTNSPKAYTEYVPYAKVLMKKIEDESVKNIGVVASYGAGKSSLIKTLIEDETFKDKELKKKAITVSLANYESIIKNVKKNKKDKEKNIHLTNEVNEDKKSIKDDESFEVENEQKIEKSILQQLFYKNNNKKTPSSRFTALKDYKVHNIMITICSMIALLTILFLSFQFYDNLFFVPENKKWRWHVICLAIALAVSSIGLITYNVIKRKLLKSIHLGEFNFEKADNDNISVFNQYLDEIIYFFQKNDFTILIIEDLDRFKNLEIFSKLKELNTLLNNNDEIIQKHKKITFIYAVKDSMFKNEEERSKFFEFILPVIPSITTSNVKDQLKKTIVKKLGKIEISNQVINDISDYIKSRRILNNIINDFIVYLSFLKIGKSDQKKVDKLFSLMALKNILPQEYEHLQNQSNESTIYYLLNNKKTEIEKQILKNIDSEIVELDEKISELNKETLKNFNELKMMLCGAIAKEAYYGFKSLTEDIESFKNLKQISYTTYSGGYNYQITLSTIEEKYFGAVNFFHEREQLLMGIKENKGEELKKQKNKLLEKKYQIVNMSFKELYADFPEKIEKNLFDKEFIKLVMVNGYIDETHMDYLSLQSYEYITENDKSIIKRINMKEDIGIFERIDSSEKLIMNITDSRFMSTNILNFNIVKELVINSRKYGNKYGIMIDCLKQNETEAIKFIEDIINSNEEYISFIIPIFKNIPSLWIKIYDSSNVTNQAKETLFWNVINSNQMELQDIKNINIKNCFFDYLNERRDFANKYNSNKFKLDELCEIGNIELENLENFNKNDISTYILENDKYKLNANNIKAILVEYYGKIKSEVYNKNFDVILSMQECSFKNKIMKNLNEYVVKIYGEIECGELTSNGLIYLLTSEQIEKKYKIEIINKEKNKVFYNENLEVDLVENLLEKKQIQFEIENIIDIYDDVRTDLIVEYIEENTDLLNINKEIFENSKEFRDFFFENVHADLYLEKIGDNYENIRNFSDYNVDVMIKNKKCMYCRKDFIEFCNKDKFIKEYCELFYEEISVEIENRAIKFTPTCISQLYFISKTISVKLFNNVVKIMNQDSLEKVLNQESPEIVVQDINDINLLNNECKEYLLNRNISNKQKENILCNMKDITNDSWVDLLRNALNFNENVNRYCYDYNETFYRELKERGVRCTKRREFLKISFED